MGGGDTTFEVEIGSAGGPDGYLVRVVRAPAGGEPQASTTLPVGQLLDRRARLQDLLIASSYQSRGLPTEQERPLRETGRQLFEALFPAGPVRQAYLSSLAAAAGGLRLVLRVTAPELAVLPWEAMWDPDPTRRGYVCHEEPLVRHVPAPYSPEPLRVDGPLRVLGLVASPRGLPPLDADTERAHIQAALDAPIRAGRTSLDWVDDASWDSLLDHLITGQWHVLHFIGHGDYDDTVQEGRPHWVEARDLASLLGEADPVPQLVVLNSCASGQSGTSDLLSGTAAVLVTSGITAVAAMQFAVSDRAASKFPHGFYTALVAGRPVDVAMRAGRKSIMGIPHSLEWVTPVLYLRGKSARLFTLPTQRPARGGPPEGAAPAATPTVEEPPPRAASDRRWPAALGAVWTGRWQDAVGLFTALQADYPHDPDLASRLAEAQQRRDLADWTAQARAAAQAQDWDTAISRWDQVLAVDPASTDAAQQLQQARTGQRLQRLHADLSALHAARQWQAVLDVAAELQALDPAQADPDGLASHARQQLADGERDDRYTQAVTELDQGRWQTAADLLQDLTREQPGFRDAAALLHTARQGLAEEERRAQRERNLSAQFEAASTAPPLQTTTLPASEPTPPTSSVRTRVHKKASVMVPAAIAAAGIVGISLLVWGLAQSTDDAQPSTDESLRTLTGHDGWVTSVAWSPDGTTLASSSAYDTARLWDAASGDEQATLTGHDNGVFSVAWSPDGTTLASGVNDPTVRLWDAASGDEQATLTGHDGLVWSVAWSPDGTTLASGGDDGTVRLWDAASGDEQATLTGHDGRVTSVAWSPDGTTLASGGIDGTVRLWDAASGDEQATLTGPAVWSVAWSPDGTTLATACSDETVRLWDAASGDEQASLTGHDGRVYSVAWSPDGTTLASGGDDGTVRLWAAPGS
jgi:Tol biopolymer transport system component